MPNKDIVVIGASTGGIEALQKIVHDLPVNYQGTIFVVVHTSSSSPNVLHKILANAGKLPASTGKDWEEFRPGHIYVAPADYHFIIEKAGHMRLSRGPKENRFRPAVDPLFRSAAYAFGPRVVGIVLTGFLDDGTAGLWAVKEQGGTAIVQNPEEAMAPPMPLNALKHVEVDHCITLQKIPPLLIQLSNTPASEKGVKPVTKRMQAEVNIAKEDKAINSGILEWGEPSIYACPECHGVLLQLKEGSNIRFRCHTGHAYSVETLLTEITEQTEESLWNAIRSLEEAALLMHRMADHLKAHQHTEAAVLLQGKAGESMERADRIREVLMREKPSAISAEIKEVLENGTAERLQH
ncbi:MAG: chemotaxis protein CheB [Verrucomicrobiales bacterium]